jgi:hypothetical protein
MNRFRHWIFHFNFHWLCISNSFTFFTHAIIQRTHDRIGSVLVTNLHGQTQQRQSTSSHKQWKHRQPLVRWSVTPPRLKSSRKKTCKTAHYGKLLLQNFFGRCWSSVVYIASSNISRRQTWSYLKKSIFVQQMFQQFVLTANQHKN